jgi:hypothetical protein
MSRHQTWCSAPVWLRTTTVKCQATHRFATRLKVWLMPKRSCHHARLHDSWASRVNDTDKFTAIRLIAFVLVQSCQPHKHRQSVEKPCYATVVAVLVSAYTCKLYASCEHWSLTNCVVDTLECVTTLLWLSICSDALHQSLLWVLVAAQFVLYELCDWSVMHARFTRTVLCGSRHCFVVEQYLMHYIRACFRVYICCVVKHLRMQDANTQCCVITSLRLSTYADAEHQSMFSSILALWDWAVTNGDVTRNSVLPPSAWAMMLMHYIRACFGYKVYVW